MHQPLGRRARRTLVAATATAALATVGAVVLPSTAQAAEQISNGTFATTSTSPWYAYGHATSSFKVVEGALCADIPAGTTNIWDAAIATDGLPTIAGENYKVSFRAKASRAVTVNAYFQHGSDPYELISGGNPQVGTEFKEFSYTGSAAGTWTNGQMAFQLGGKAQDYTFCIDDVSIVGGVEAEVYEPDTGPRVRVNQVGYLPQGPKGATVVTDATSALDWKLLDASGTSVASGTTTPAGVAVQSGENVHTVDFTSYTTAGEGYTLVADGETSHPFAITADLYEPLRKDSKTLFYTNRSGIEILDSIVPGYGRAAGHIGVAPNKGDTAVPCQSPIAATGSWTCDPSVTFDVSGGWYDAGDHGKYVVNAGISVAQLLAEWERNQSAESADADRLGDSTLRVPETGNDVPDILDEARWELEWMLKMQVPATVTDPGLTPYKGMAFMKVHDAAWTGLPLDPAKDDKVRELHRPSTAATLNLAAAAAQGARAFETIDAAFSAELLSAAKTAYAAAKANPAVYAPAADSTGGGSYSDSTVTDEFYWAAAELFLATGDPAYSTDVQASALHTKDIFDLGGFSWQSVAALGRLDLATVTGKAPVPGLESIRASVVAAADKMVAMQAKEPYGQVFAPRNAGWFWGSNSQILNNMVVIGTAYDITGEAKYANAVLSGMDFLLGRNALNISYVTGYGTVYSKNQHSRMYANQVDVDSPNPPAGTVAGGPNASLDDQIAEKNLTGCVGMFCYIDDIQSYSTNELTINWNSALSWVASFVADLDGGVS